MSTNTLTAAISTFIDTTDDIAFEIKVAQDDYFRPCGQAFRLTRRAILEQVREGETYAQTAERIATDKYIRKFPHAEGNLTVEVRRVRRGMGDFGASPAALHLPVAA